MARVHPQLDDPGLRSAPRRSRWLWLAALALLLTGCASVPSNTPEAYTDTAADGTVIVEANYLSACEESGETSSDCQCFYDAIVDTIPFEDFKAGAAEQIPVARTGKPNDIAHAVSFFASEGAGFVSGQVLYVAGGPKA